MKTAVCPCVYGRRCSSPCVPPRNDFSHALAWAGVPSCMSCCRSGTIQVNFRFSLSGCDGSGTTSARHTADGTRV